MRKLTLSILASAAALVASPALAQTVNVDTGSGIVNLASGGSTTIYFNGYDQGTVYSGLTSDLMLTFVGYSAGAYNFSYTLDNTSTATAGGRVVGFGFNDTPDATLSNATGVFTNIGSGSISNSFSVEDCVTTGNSGANCSGGGGGGVVFGTSGSGAFTLTTANTSTSLLLDNFIDRYQASLITPGGSGVGLPVGVGGPTVPEPATWAMMLVGFGAAGVSLRRRRKVTALQAA